MKNFIWIAFIALAIIATLAFWGCSKSTDPPQNTGPTEEQLQQLEDIQQTQLEYYTELEILLEEMDTASAKDSIVAIMATDTLIEWALVTLQGINIQWEAGFGGTLLLDPKRSYSGDLGRATGENRRSLKSNAETGIVCPKSKKTLYLAVCYTEFAYYEDKVIDSANAVFTQAGYDSFEVYKDEECSFSWFHSVGLLDEYGIVRITSHGGIWPSDTDIQNVYLLTGEVVNRETDIAIYDDFISGLIHISTIGSSTYYAIDGAFFAAANDFSYEKSFISLGFCYSALGNWPTDLVNFSGASAVIGYSWQVFDTADASWMENFFGQMCDTSRETPLTIGEWDAGSDRLYYNTEYSRWVALLYSGADSMTLWMPFRITSITPTSGMEDTIVTIRGVGFGDSQAQVRFNDVVGTDISTWSDTLIRVAVPAGFTEGTVVIVTVVVDGSQTNGVEFTIETATENLMDQLWTMNDIEIEFRGEIIYVEELEEGGNDIRITSYRAGDYLPLVWSDNTVSSNGTIESSTGWDHLINIQITFSPDGQSIVSMTAEDTETARPGSMVTGEHYSKLAFVNIPLGGSSETQISYTEYDVQSIATDLDISSAGSQGYYAFESIDWTEYSSIEVNFR